MTPLDYIFIADSCTPRIEEMSSLCHGFAPNIEVFNGTNTEKKDALALEVGERTDTILRQGGRVMVITNCIMGVGAKVLHIVRGNEARHNNGARKILMTCKSGAQVNRGLKKRGVSRVGLRHVHWDGEDPREHQDVMRRILRSTLPNDSHTRQPWEMLRDKNQIIPPAKCDASFDKMISMFPLPDTDFLGCILIEKKKYLVVQKNGNPWIYTQLYGH